ncbi:toxin-antitoxin system TumE family protein [Archaeoglobus neptunius]|uniref:toxin-antitoxin system TumE family protein n=1 Tax=Archaeoglobus neptunius TaxID=2798580 RepID=UPI0019259314|nr:DUF6516 family protein [Archaeoglobus neptunius]
MVSFVDVWISERLSRYAYHWERRHIDGKVFRHDNIPHAKWKYVETFPKHFHNGSEGNVVESYISEKPEEAVKEFLTFVKEKLIDNK